MIRKFRKKPVEIEAIEFDSENTEEIIAWADGQSSIRHHDGALTIETLEGDMTVSPGDFVIRGVQGEFYPCKPDIFAKSYEEIA